MSYEDGWAALNMETPKRVPRTEYSAEGHWALVAAVTGIPVTEASPEEERERARRAFVRAWNYGLYWNVCIFGDYMGRFRTDMGHAVYVGSGADFKQASKPAFANPEDALTFDPAASLPELNHDELVRRFEENYRFRSEAFPEAVATTGVYITLMSGLIDMLGWDTLLMAAGEDQKRFGGLAKRYSEWAQTFFEALASSNVPVVMIHDDITWTSGPFLHPDWYREFVFPAYRRYIAPLREAGKKILFTSDGDFTAFLDDLVACGVDGVVMEPVTDMGYFARRYGKTHVFVGNADTRVLLSGTKGQIRAEVKRCMDIGKGCPGFFLAVGNHIPANTPVENALYYNQVYEEMSRR